MSTLNHRIALRTSKNSKSQRTLIRSVRAAVEMLENRTLLSASLSGTTLNITGTGAADTFTLSDSGSTITVKQGTTTSTFADSAVSKIVVNPTAGGDTFNLQSTTKPITITGGGLDTVNIGNSNSLQQIKAAVTIANPSSFTGLNLNGVADISNSDSGGASHSGTLTASTISLSPGTITYTASQLSALSITTSYIVNVNGTGSLHAGAPTIITTGSGDSPAPTINITATTGALTINGSDDEGNQINVGLGDTQNIRGTILVNNDDLTGTVLNIDDSNDTTGRNGSLSGQRPITVSGFSPASILFNEDADGVIIINAGQGNDTITAASAPFDEGDIIHGNGGNDTIIVPTTYNGPFEMTVTGDAGNDTLNYSGSDAIPSFDGGAGSNQVTFDQTTKTNASAIELHPDGTINDNNTSGASALEAVPSTISQVNVLLGPTNDTVTADAGWNIPLNIHGGAGNDTLIGGSANDSLFGDDGNDSLNGGLGSDVLTGGTGIDSLNAGDGQPIEIIADNIANAPVSGSQGITVNGNWIASTSTPGFYATNYITDNNSLKGTKNVVFTPSIPTAGTYQVFARWTTGPTRATNVPISVLHQGTTTTVTENQQTNNNTWVSLGTFALNAGTSSSVTISNTGTNGYVIADAVRFLAVQATSSNVSLSGTTLNITGTSGADTTTLSDNGTTIFVVFNGATFNFPDSSVTKISVNPSAGGDTVNLLSNTKPVSITGGGLDTVDIGGGTLQKIAAAVSVDNPTSFTNLTLDGSSDPDTGLAGQNGTLNASTFSNPSIGVITYNAPRLSALGITQGNAITVNNTGVLHNNAPTLIHGISTVLATTGALTIDLTGGGFATIGQGTVQNIKGALIVEQSESTGSELSINDANDTVGRNVSLDRFLTITGLAPVPIIYQGADDEAELDLSMGSGNDTLAIAGGAWPVTNIDLGGGNDLVNFEFATDETTINGGAGNDTLHIDAGDQLGQFSTFDGGIGTNSVVIDNTAGPFEGPWEIGDNGVGTGLGVMTFANVQAISFLGGSVNNIVDANTSAAVALLIHGGDGDDTINVNSPNATVFGDAGNDTITAGNGNVSINGGDGNDSLTGGTGATLSGGTGIDTLNGGNGQPLEIIADNIANTPVSGSQGVTLNGNWIASTSTPGFYATNYITDNNSLKGTKSVTFTPNIPTAGTYQVFARWTTGPTRATNVPFSVLHQGTTTTVTENQQLNNNVWVSLGTFALNAGTSSSVTISNTGTDGYVIADAVRFLAVPAAPSNVTLTGTTLNITGTSAADTTTLSDNGTNITVIFNGTTYSFADSAVTKISVNPSTGGDTVNLLSNTKPITITGGGADTVNITNSGSLSGINADVSVGNSGSHTNLTIDASADNDQNMSRQVTLTNSSIINVATGAISYTASQLSSLILMTTYQVTVASTGVLANGGQTTIDGSDGLDSNQHVSVQTTTGPLTINTTSYLDLGNAGSMQGIAGAIVWASGSVAALTVDDSADTIGRTVVSDGSNIIGISPATIQFHGDVRSIIYSGGSGNDNFSIADGAADVGTEVDGNGGNDTLTVGAGDFEDVSNVVYFDGGDGTNLITADESAATGDRTASFRIDSSFFPASGMLTTDQIRSDSINGGYAAFINAQVASVLFGSGNDTLDTDPAITIPLFIHGGAGNDTLNGGSGNDSLFGDDGNDALGGGAGTDVLTGGTGIDTLDGGDGQPLEIIADNIANAPVSGSQGVTVNGNWIASTSTPGFYATNYISDNNTLKGTKSVVFTPNIPTSGTYQVFARWTTGPTRATNVPFSVLHQGTTTTVTENQQTNNNTWVSLGTFALNAGTSSSVTISNTGTNGYVIADAVRFLSVPAAASNVTLNGTTLNITGTPNADTTTLSDNGTNITVVFNGATYTFADSAVTKISVNPSTGGDTVNLLSNTKPVSIIGGGLDTVNVTNNGSLNGIAAAVSIDNPTSFTNLTIDGSADQEGAASGTLTATTLSGISTGTVTYNAARLSAFTINTVDQMTVNDTGVLHNSVATIVNGTSSSIFGTTGPLTFNIANGNQMFIGNGNMQSIKGLLNINSDPAFNGIDLHLNDSTDTVARNISVSGSLNFTGISPAPIDTTGTDGDSDLFLSAGQGNDTITIDGGTFDADNHYDLGNGNNTINFLSGGIITDITSGSGNDTLNIGNGSAPDEILNFDGGTGTNALSIDDSTNILGGSPFFISNSGIGYSDDGRIGITNVQKITIFGSPTDNLFTTDASTTIPLVIHGNTGNDVIYGGTANDTLYGGGGNDTIFGMAGNDSIFGEAGNDSLNGGQGNDVITGGTGIDTIDSGEGDGVHIIADDIAPQGVTVTGNWISSTSTPGFYAADYLTDNNSLKGTKSVKWAPTIPVAGAYQVYAQWTAAANRATNVPYDIVHQGVTTTVTENQQQNNGTWVLLGTYNFDAGSGASVTVRNTGTNGYVIADAVRFIPVVATASISGTVFNDSNANGKQDPGEGGTTYFSTVYIDLNKDGVLDNNEPSIQADNGGNWSFTNLAAGTYRIRKVNQANVNRTVPAAGFYDVTITTGAVSSDIYGLIFGDHAVTPASVPAISVNAGGPDLVLNSGDSFSADNHFTGGAAISSAYDVANTDNDPLYYSYRSGTSFSYSIPVASGNYNLVLWFADPTKTAAGQRVFNVTAQGQQVLTNFDIFATGGAKTPVIKTIPITITQDVLTLSFIAVTDNAIISAFAIYPT